MFFFPCFLGFGVRNGLVNRLTCAKKRHLQSSTGTLIPGAGARWGRSTSGGWTMAVNHGCESAVLGSEVIGNEWWVTQWLIIVLIIVLPKDRIRRVCEQRSLRDGIWGVKFFREEFCHLLSYTGIYTGIYLLTASIFYIYPVYPRDSLLASWDLPSYAPAL